MEDAHASVCDKDVERSELRDGRLDEVCSSLGLSNVAADSNQFRVLGYVGFERFEQLGGLVIAQVIHCDGAALSQVFDGDCSSDTRDTAGDCAHFSSEEHGVRECCHDCVLVSCRRLCQQGRNEGVDALDAEACEAGREQGERNMFCKDAFGANMAMRACTSLFALSTLGSRGHRDDLDASSNPASPIFTDVIPART